MRELPKEESDGAIESRSGCRSTVVKGSRRPTIRDVAAAAGVSRGTVSRVLNDSSAVRPGTRQVVLDAIARTRFVASATARSLNTARTGSIALVVTERYERVFEDPSFSLMVRALQEQAERVGLLMFIVLAETNDARARIVDRAVSGSVDGLLLLSTHGNDPIFRIIVEAGLPAVVCGEPLGIGAALPFIKLGDRMGSRNAVRHLAEMGCRSILVIVGPGDTASSQNRERGARDGVLALRMKVQMRIVRCDEYSVEDGFSVVKAIESLENFDAVFCASDVLAIGALAACAERGLVVPDDLQFVTFDDTAFSSTHVPALTSVALPFDECAEASISLLSRVLEGGHPAPVELECILRVRESTRPVGGGQDITPSTP